MRTMTGWYLTNHKLHNLLLLVSSLFVHLEWGGNNAAFLWEAELDVLAQMATNPAQAVHPFTLIPLFGQLLLLGTLVQKKTSKTMSLLGLFCLAVLVVFILLVGILALNWSTILSCFPFLLFGTLGFYTWKNKKAGSK